jgi:hypothetical protein
VTKTTLPAHCKFRSPGQQAGAVPLVPDLVGQRQAADIIAAERTVGGDADLLQIAAICLVCCAECQTVRSNISWREVSPK